MPNKKFLLGISELYLWSECCDQRHILRTQATQHGCLPSLLGDEEKQTEIEDGEEKNILYRAD